MRRLPIYFLIDVSESMVGDPLLSVEEGMASVIKAIKTDPTALETVWISIIVFAGRAKTLVPLQEVVSFYPPKFSVGGGTSLSTGLRHLMAELNDNIVKTTLETKGDWKPIVFLFTDGVATDDTQTAISAWQKTWGKTANLVAISFGADTDLNVLSHLTSNVFQFQNTTIDDYKKFFKWVTDSIKVSSVSVERHATGFELASVDGSTVSKIDLSKSSDKTSAVDANFVVLAGKCQNTKKPYLIKYRKVINQTVLGGLEFDTRAYRLVGGFQVNEGYNELSNETAHQSKVNTGELMGAPACPSCGNQLAFAVCSCLKIHCIGDEEVSTCPWCSNKGHYGIGEGGFDVNRTQG